MSRHGLVNGVVADVVPADDRGLHYGHGLFETMRLSAGGIPLWSRHRGRLLRDAVALGIPCEAAVIDRELQVALARWPREGVVKLIVTAGAGGAGYRTEAPLRANRIFGYRPPPAPRAPLRAQLCRHRLADNPQLAGIKHLNRLDQVLAARELSPGTEGLLQDVAGQVVEGLSGNLFVKTAAGWRTPPLARAGVRGVMRELLLDEIFPVLGIPVVEHEVAVEEMFAAEALFLCNAVRGIEPVAWVEPANRLLEIAPVRVIARALERRWSCFASC
ncbi:MAG: hypothetical protein AMXMBFR26_01260 [Porticoccaceae bacterium]